MGHPHQLAPPVAFFHLPVDEPRRHLPQTHCPPSTTSYEPVSEMGCQRIEVRIEPITGEEWNAARCQELSQRMDDSMGHVLCTGAELKHWQNLGARVDRQPKPLHLRMAAQPRAQFVQLQVREPQMAEETLVQGLCVFPGASQPGGDRGLSK